MRGSLPAEGGSRGLNSDRGAGFGDGVGCNRYPRIAGRGSWGGARCWKAFSCSVVGMGRVGKEMWCICFGI